jgi:hypothetical protein
MTTYTYIEYEDNVYYSIYYSYEPGERDYSSTVNVYVGNKKGTYCQRTYKAQLYVDDPTHEYIFFDGALWQKNIKFGVPISEAKNINELINVIYSEEVFLEIHNNHYSIEQLNNKYPIECLRKIEDEGYYSAIYKGNNRFYIFYYYDNGEKFSYSIEAKYSIESQGLLNSIIIGMSLEDVMVIDENGTYTFLYTGDIHAPKISTHYTIDGYIVQIYYDDNECVQKIFIELL